MGERLVDDRNLPAVNACIREIGRALELPVIEDPDYPRDNVIEEMPLRIVATLGGGVVAVRVLYMEVVTGDASVEVPTVCVELHISKTLATDEGGYALAAWAGLPILAERPQDFTAALTQIAGLLQCGRLAKKAAKIAERHGLLFEDGCYVLPDAACDDPGVLSVVGGLYRASGGQIVRCFGHDPRHGFWVEVVREGDIPGEETVGSRRAVSEKAIDRTLHRLDPRNLDAELKSLCAEPTVDYAWEAGIAAVEASLGVKP